MFVNCQFSTGKRCTLKQIPLDRPTCAACAERCPLDGPKCGATRKQSLQVQPVPRAEWPLWANAVAKLATDADKGVGSTVDRLLGVGGKAYKATMKAMGVPCGCNRRKDEWDVMYGY